MNQLFVILYRHEMPLVILLVIFNHLLPEGPFRNLVMVNFPVFRSYVRVSLPSLFHLALANEPFW